MSSSVSDSAIKSSRHHGISAKSIGETLLQTGQVGYFIPDFSNWKNHDAFESAFARLKKDLEAENSTK
jgi:hypothetical protein